MLRIMETEKKNRVLKKAAENLVADAETIIAANALDMEHGKEKGMSLSLIHIFSETGSKYHNKNNCGRMNPDRAYQMTRENAEAQGYEPCKKCF